MPFVNENLWTSTAKVDAVRVAFAKEAQDPQPATKYGDIPFTYELIRASWLTETLRGDVEGAEVVRFELGPPDDGTANRRRIGMVWNQVGKRGGRPESVFCKATQSLNNRLVLSWGGVDSEVNFYNELRPLLDIETPTSLYATFDRVSYNSIVVLRDLGSSVKFNSHKTVVTLPMITDLLKLLAVLHGKFYKSTLPVVEKFITIEELWTGFSATIDVEGACANGFRDSKSVIPESLFRRAGEIWPATVKSWKRNSQLPASIVHTDLHLGNTYQTTEGKMGIQDYQMASRGHFSRDIVYLIVTCLSPEDRRAWEKDLVRFYLAEFAKSGGEVVAEEEVWEEMSFQLLSVLQSWTLTMTPSSDMPDMQPQAVSFTFIHRISEAMVDYDSLGVAAKY